jgi:D-amino peptidase
VDGVFFVGYHARAGSLNAILDHTWSTGRVANVYLNGVVVGEIGLNASLCGHFGAPVLMISGDQTACVEAVTLLGPVETAIVKHASGRNTAECLPPQASHPLIRAAAQAGVARLRAGQAPQPLHVATPVTVAVEFNRSEQADGAAIVPGAMRVSGRRVEFIAADMPTAYRAFRSLVGMAP